MADYEQLKADYARLRDEARLQLDLASKEAKQQWEDAEERWKKFIAEANPQKTQAEFVAAGQQVLDAMRDVYERMKKAI
jgi:hypothetical protein